MQGNKRYGLAMNRNGQGIINNRNETDDAETHFLGAETCRG